MPKLSCKDLTCSHNKNELCSKDVVLISDKAYCHSYDKKVFSGMEKLLEEYSSQVYDNEFSNDLMSQCDEVICRSEKCCYNCVGTCDLESLEVRVDGEGPRCHDYKEER